MDIAAFAYGLDSPPAAYGSATGAGLTAGSLIQQISAANLPAGNYDVVLFTRLQASGTEEVAGLENNMEFRIAGTVIKNRLNSTKQPGRYVIIQDVALNGSQAITVNATATGTTTCLYRATLMAVRKG